MPLIGSSSLASHETAWRHSHTASGFSINATLPLDHLTWGAPATRHAVSWHRVDADGLATVVRQVAGLKFWVVGTPKDLSRSLSNPLAFDGWDPIKSFTEHYDYEGVLLRPGDTL